MISLIGLSPEISCFSPFKSLPYMLRDSSSTERLLENSAQHTCAALLLLGKEISIESHHSRVFPPTLVAPVVNY